MGAGASADGNIHLQQMGENGQSIMLTPDQIIRSVLGGGGNGTEGGLFSLQHHHHHHHNHRRHPNDTIRRNPFDDDDGDEYDDMTEMENHSGEGMFAFEHRRQQPRLRSLPFHPSSMTNDNDNDNDNDILNDEEENGGEEGEQMYFCHPCGRSFWSLDNTNERNGPTVEIVNEDTDTTNTNDTTIDSTTEEYNRLNNIEGKQSMAEDVVESKSEDVAPTTTTTSTTSSTTSVSSTTSTTSSSELAVAGSGLDSPVRTRTASSTAPTPGGEIVVPSLSEQKEEQEQKNEPEPEQGRALVSLENGTTIVPGDELEINVSCPHCGDNFVELARMPRPRRRRRMARLQRRRDVRRNEAMHVQALLSALRASIVNQLEEAELQTAMRQSMENYTPHMSPACKMSITSIVDSVILKGTGSDHKISSTGTSTTMDQLSENSCPICAEDYIVGDTVVARLPMCKHSYHSHCIKKWFEVNNTCPICRSVLPAKCQSCMDNQKEAQELIEQRDHARARARSESESGENGEGSGGIGELGGGVVSTANDVD